MWEESFTMALTNETNKRIIENARLLEDAKRVAAEMAALWFNGQWFTASFKKTDSEWKTTTVQRTINITNAATINNNLDEKKFLRKVAKMIEKAEQTGNKV